MVFFPPTLLRSKALIGGMRAVSTHSRLPLPSPSSWLMGESKWCDGLKQARVLIAPSYTPDTKEGTTKNDIGRLLSLRHPKTGDQACYLFRNDSLEELHWFKQSHGSWFLGDYICEDGSLYIATPVDPAFVFLPLFEKARMKTGNDRGMFRELNEILYVDGYPAYQWLLPIAEGSMRLLCDIKEIGSSKFFRLDESKVLAWLCLKANNLKEALATLDKNYAAQGEQSALMDAMSLLREYLNDDPWVKLLCSHLKLDLQNTTTRPLDQESLLSAANNVFRSPPSQTKSSRGRNTTSTGEQAKKLRTQVDSQNIKDMFRRVTRNGGT